MDFTTSQLSMYSLPISANELLLVPYPALSSKWYTVTAQFLYRSVLGCKHWIASKCVLHMVRCSSIQSVSCCLLDTKWFLCLLIRSLGLYVQSTSPTASGVSNHWQWQSESRWKVMCFVAPNNPLELCFQQKVCFCEHWTFGHFLARLRISLGILCSLFHELLSLT